MPEEHDGLDATETGALTVPVSRPRKGFAMAVFDGMGGESDGQTASYTAAQVFGRRFSRIDAASTEAFFDDVVRQMNEAVAERARKRLCHMGTTVVSICFLSDDYYICNVGDSRAFLLRENDLLQISVDHTDAAILRRQGITDRKPRLSQYLGMYDEGMVITPYIACGKVRRGDQFLLCSDGLTDMLQPDVIEYIMRKTPSVKKCVDWLIEAALENGGVDNVTAIVIRADSG